ncbi:MAG TPA: phosphoribosyltransferase family protein [Ohtaekwangia sp.]|nr:phosphoribosyltransferase family protein [Ohtaekwangia sp.]
MIQQGRIFANRSDAGHELGKFLEAQYKNEDAVVLGIPRGGVVVAYEVAKLLNAELSVLITKKLPHPSQQELAIGATAEDGSAYLTSLAGSIKEEIIRRIVKEQTTEIESRIQRFRRGETFAFNEEQNRYTRRRWYCYRINPSSCYKTL